jgi:type IV pilus assembly protein PilE
MCNSTNRRHGKGFTLIEVMMVVAILGILVAIALPSYQNSVMRTWRSKGAACLTNLAQAMERRFSANMSYAIPATVPANGCTTEDGMAQRYAFSFTDTPTATAYTLQAVPQGAQAARDTECGTLSINQLGARTASVEDADISRCW